MFWNHVVVIRAIIIKVGLFNILSFSLSIGLSVFGRNSLLGEDCEVELDVPDAVVRGTLLAQECVQHSDDRTGAVWERLLQSNSEPLTNISSIRN